MLRFVTDSTWITLTALVLGLLFWWWSTSYLTKTTDRPIAVAIRVLRLTGLFLLISLAVNGQVIWQTTRSIPPSVALYVDNSLSTQPYASVIEESVQSVRKLLDDADVETHFIAFGEEATPVNRIPALTHDDPVTDLSAPIRHLEENAREMNIQAALIVSDGKHTSGVLPETYAPDQALRIPLYTFFAGDTVSRPDIRLERFTIPGVVYAEDSVPVSARLSTDNLAREHNLRYEIEGPNEILYSDILQLTPGTYSRDITDTITFAEAGVYQVTARIAQMDGEADTTNNRFVRSIEVRPSRYQVLLAGESPSFETRFLTSAIGEMDRFQVSAWYTSLAGQAPSQDLFTDAEIVYIIGNPGDNVEIMERVRQEPDIRGVVLQMDSGGLIGSGNLSETPSSWLEEGVQLRNIGRNPLSGILAGSTVWESLPPVWTTSPPGFNRDNETVLLTGQTSGNPVMFLNGNENPKRITLSGQHFWRWQFAGDQAGDGIPADFYRSIYSRLFYWLLQSDPTDRLQVATDVDRRNVLQAEAQVFTPAMQPVGIAQVWGEVVDSAGQVIARGLFRRDDDVYRYQRTIMRPGTYRFRTRAFTATDTLEKTSSPFRLNRLNLESTGTPGDPERLRQISNRFDGRLLNATTDFPVEELSEASVLRTVRSRILHFRRAHWLWGVILLLFAADWLIRRRNGLL